MRYTRQSLAIICLLLGVSLSLGVGKLNARDADSALTAARTGKQQCINACRARYRDCRHLNQLPSFECRSVYQDCSRYACTGLGPG